MSFLESLNPFIMPGMIVGGTTKAIIDSTKGVTDACKGLADAEKQLKDTRDKWNNIISQQNIEINLFTDFKQSLATSKNNLEIQTRNASNAYKKHQYALITGICLMIISVIVTLLFKKLKVFSYLKKLIFS